MAETDWARIRTEYITGRESLKALGEKHGIGYSAISKRSSQEQWAQERKKYAKTVQKKALARAGAHNARQLADLKNAGTKMCRELQKLMANAEEELYTHVGTESDGKYSVMVAKRLPAVDDRKLLNLTKAMREMTAVMRDLYDIQTASEREEMAMAREKLAMEREKMSRAEKQDTQVEIVMGEEAREYVG